MSFLREHWRLGGELVCLLALACTSWAAFHRDPPAAIQEKASEHHEAAAAAKMDVREDVGGWSVSTFEFAPEKATAPCGAVGLPDSSPKAKPAASPDTMIPHGDLVKLIVEKHDPTVIASHSSEMVQASDDRNLELKVTPAPAPGWALQVGAEDLFGARAVRVAGRRRLFGGLWVEVSVLPTHGTFGAAVSYEF